VTSEAVSGTSRRLTLAVGAERAIGRFRLASAIVVLPASTYVLLGPHPFPAKALAFLGVLASIGYVVAFFRARARVRGSGAFHLDLADDGMTLCLAGRSASIGWSDIDDVDVDEERLMVVVRVHDGHTVDIPPVWEGVGLYDLAAMLRKCRDGACRPDDG
jgi:hypothetical protein